MKTNMKRGDEVRSAEWFGVRLYVGTKPTGQQHIVVKEIFEESCQWFDGMESMGWQAW